MRTSLQKVFAKSHRTPSKGAKIGGFLFGLVLVLVWFFLLLFWGFSLVGGHTHLLRKFLKRMGGFSGYLRLITITYFQKLQAGNTVCIMCHINYYSKE